MKKKIVGKKRVSRKSIKRGSIGATALSLSQTASRISLDQPNNKKEIDEFVTDMETQMEAGGVSVQEAQIALMTEFPSPPSGLQKDTKGRNSKQ